MAPATHTWLARFADAMQFVPPDMQSHWFRIREVAAEGNEPAHHWLEVWAGRDFQPTWDVGVGSYVGVSVDDYGVGGITLADFVIEANERREPIGGSAVWCTEEQKRGKDGEQHPREKWSAVVANRFVVTATSNALLRAALTRDHTPRFGSLEPLPAVPPDTRELVLRDLAGTPPPTDTPPGTNPGGVSAVFAFASDPPRIQVWSRDERAPRDLLWSCVRAPTNDWQPLPGPQDRHAVEYVLPKQSQDDLGMTIELACWLLFGVSIFI